MTATHNMSTARAYNAGVGASGWHRGGALAGVVFAVLFIASMLMPTTGYQDMTDEEVMAHINDGGEQTLLILSAYLMAVAGIAFMFFLAALRRVLAIIDDESGVLASFVTIAGGVFVAMLFAGIAAIAAVAGGVAIGGEPTPSADVIRMFPQLGHAFVLLYGMLAASAMIAASSVLIRRSRALPTWLAWTGFVCAFLLLAGVMFMPTLALPIWVIATSVVLYRRDVREPDSATRTQGALAPGD